MYSIIIPLHNEEQNIPELFQEIREVMEQAHLSYEVVFVNDGSTDGSLKVIKELSLQYNQITVFQERVRKGKGKALSNGIHSAKGDIIVFMDGDMQDDPHDLLRFFSKLDDGYDFVNGIRTTRKDTFIIKIYSKFFNWFLRSFLNSPLTDINCGFKVFKREILEDIPLYGNNFRFLPLATHLLGYKVGEVHVHNRNRKYGKPKYGIGKPFIGAIDTLSAYFLFRFAERPLHFFGIVGGLFFFVGFILALWMSYERIVFGVLLYRRPALLMAVSFIIVGIQIIMTGIIGELIVYLNKKSNK
ncbi:MAG: glycosyltransferase family 2 protein [Candidatus Roizmanbacteria bacterium]